ncbi:hypothetical protein ATP82_24690, partial [Salmonella enterica]|nr:hypothetical protein [Salmonella enterica]
SIAGWTFAQAQCSPTGSLSANYALPEGGTVADFASRLPYWYPGIPAGFNIPGAANMASFTLTFAPPASTYEEVTYLILKEPKGGNDRKKWNLA